MLTDEEAYAILEPFFKATRALFAERGLSRCKRVRFRIDPEGHDTPRHFAGCMDDGSEVVVAPELADLPVDNVVAIFAHEFGHAADYLYPARFFVADGELIQRAEPRRSHSEMDAREEFNRRAQWEHRDDDAVEVTADHIAGYVTGREIHYAGACVLQTYGPGVPRPRRLR